MNKWAKFAPGAVLALALVSSLSTPSQAAIEDSHVTVSIPTKVDTDFNAIATWDAAKQTACLYSADHVKPSESSEQPWVRLGDCKTWVPEPGFESGIYVLTWDSGRSKALLVASVQPKLEATHSILVIVPDYTWQAYNLQKNGSFYFEEVGKKAADFSKRKLNLLRPLNFTRVGDPKNYPSSEALFPSTNPISFLRELHRNVDVIAQSHIDEHGYDLSQYKAIVLYGHDEYWTSRIKAELERAVSAGTNLINLSGNTGYRKLVRSESVIGFEEPTSEHPNTSRWGDLPGDTTSVKLLGVDYLGEPFNKRGHTLPRVSMKEYRHLIRDGLPKTITKKTLHRTLSGIMVRGGSSRIFSGTGLKNGEFFGSESRVLSIEVDGVPEDSSGLVEKGFLEKFGSIPLNIGGDAWLNARSGTHGLEWRSGLLIQTRFGEGEVFSAGPIGWTAALLAGDKNVQQITKNVLKLLG